MAGPLHLYLGHRRMTVRGRGSLSLLQTHHRLVDEDRARRCAGHRCVEDGRLAPRQYFFIQIGYVTLMEFKAQAMQIYCP